MADTEGILKRDAVALGMRAIQALTPEGATYAWHPGIGEIYFAIALPQDATAATAAAAAGGIPYGVIDATTGTHVDFAGLTATGVYRLFAIGSGV